MSEQTIMEFSPSVKVEIRQVPGWRMYSVSSEGVVYSIHSGELKALAPSRGGGKNRDYIYVTLCGNDQQRRIGVHQIVAITFLPPPKIVGGKMQTMVRHRDNNPHNNRPSNLLWGTQKQNLNDRHEHGTMTHGQANGMSKITPEIVVEIRRRRSAKEKCRLIAADFGLSYQQVHRIGSGTRWKHIDEPTAARQRSARVGVIGP